MLDLKIYPGGALVAQGLEDLGKGVVSEAALLVSVAAPRLRRLGFHVPELASPPPIPEHALFEAIESRLERGAHTAYNALLAQVVSFAGAYARTAKAP